MLNIFCNKNLSNGTLNKDRGLIQYKIGTDSMPKEDDILVFVCSKYGHVAIVTKTTDSYVEIIQQNIYKKTRDRVNVNIKNEVYTVCDVKK